MTTESQKKANKKYQQTDTYKEYRKSYYQKNKEAMNKKATEYRKKKLEVKNNEPQ